MAAMGHDHSHANGTNIVSFTPASSTLAQRSQLYNDAFERSISLATKPSNAMALQASAVKTGSRSVALKTLQAVDEDLTRDDEGDDVDEDLDPNSQSAYGDARPEAHKGQTSTTGEGARQDEVSLRGLLQHIGSRW